jgi:CheY-like chemotaxis protein
MGSVVKKSASIKAQKLGAQYFKSKGTNLSEQRIRLLIYPGSETATVEFFDLKDNEQETMRNPCGDSNSITEKQFIMIRILLVDDEPDACEILQILITKHIKTPTEIAICNSPEQALKVIGVFKPSLLMLDIEMPNINGFDLLNRVGDWDFDVIFTTAYDKYAIRQSGSVHWIIY